MIERGVSRLLRRKGGQGGDPPTPGGYPKRDDESHRAVTTYNLAEDDDHDDLAPYRGERTPKGNCCGVRQPPITSAAR